MASADNNGSFYKGFAAGVAVAASALGLGYLIKTRPQKKSGVMYSYPRNPRVWKAKIVARMTGQHIADAEDFQMGVHNKEEWFLKVHPNGQVPALVVGNQEGIFESNSIARYMARGTPLYGKNDLEASRIDAFLDASLQLEGYLNSLVYKKMQTPWAAQYTPEFLAMQRQQGLRTLQAFESQLEIAGEYLVGDSVSLADIVLYCVLIRAFEWNIFEEEELKEYGRVIDHFARIGAIEEVRAVVIPPAEESDKQA